MLAGLEVTGCWFPSSGFKPPRMGLVVGCPLIRAPIGGIFLFVSNFGAVGNGLLTVCLFWAAFPGAGRAVWPAVGVGLLGAGSGLRAVPVLFAGRAGATLGAGFGVALGESAGFCGTRLVAGAGLSEGAGGSAGFGAGAGPSAGF